MKTRYEVRAYYNYEKRTGPNFDTDACLYKIKYFDGFDDATKYATENDIDNYGLIREQQWHPLGQYWDTIAAYRVHLQDNGSICIT